jgi:imidazoleglycerol phosphate synthase glutamine amidotransferase subunit HisH
MNEVQLFHLSIGKASKRKVSASDLAWSLKVLSEIPMKFTKGLQSRMVALPSVGHIPAKYEREGEAAHVVHEAATRARQILLIAVGWPSEFDRSLSIGEATALGLIAIQVK